MVTVVGVVVLPVGVGMIVRCLYFLQQYGAVDLDTEELPYPMVNVVLQRAAMHPNNHLHDLIQLGLVCLLLHEPNLPGKSYNIC